MLFKELVLSKKARDLKPRYSRSSSKNNQSFQALMEKKIDSGRLQWGVTIFFAQIYLKVINKKILNMT